MMEPARWRSIAESSTTSTVWAGVTSAACAAADGGCSFMRSSPGAGPAATPGLSHSWARPQGAAGARRLSAPPGGRTKDGGRPPRGARTPEDFPMRTHRWPAAALAAALALAGAGRAQYGDISDLKLLKPEDKKDVAGVPPPKGAVVLFDGKSLDGWVQRKDGKSPAKWKLVPGGAVEVVARSGDVMTKQKFDGSFKLHVEFRVPYMPKATGQARGNSGVYVQGRYEVQVLDSYRLKSKD